MNNGLELDFLKKYMGTFDNNLDHSSRKIEMVKFLKCDWRDI